MNCKNKTLGSKTVCNGVKNIFSKNPTSCEIELTTRCNALCPQCPRSQYGAKKWSNLPIVDLDTAIIEKILQDPGFKSVDFVRLAGTYGDPTLHLDLLNIVQLLKQRKIKLFISTNGGVQNVQWWQKLAQMLDHQDRVLFCIDGLEDTNHLYRIGVDYHKVMQNLNAFNASGGKSIWQFIVFKHNQHQIQAAKQTSVEIGCHGFAAKPSNRFVNKSHQLMLRYPVLNRKKQVIYFLEPPDIDDRYVAKNINSYQENTVQHRNYQQYLKSVPIKCEAQSKNFFAITAEGYVFPCHFLYDRLYGPEVDGDKSQTQLIDMLESTGGLDAISLYKKDLSAIFDSDFFSAVSKSWQDSTRLDRCANQCGVYSNSLTNYDEIDRLL